MMVYEATAVTIMVTCVASTCIAGRGSLHTRQYLVNCTAVNYEYSCTCFGLLTGLVPHPTYVILTRLLCGNLSSDYMFGDGE